MFLRSIQTVSDRLHDCHDASARRERAHGLTCPRGYASLHPGLKRCAPQGAFFVCFFDALLLPIQGELWHTIILQKRHMRRPYDFRIKYDVIKSGKATGTFSKTSCEADIPSCFA